MGSEAVVYLNGGAAATKHETMIGLFKRLGSGRLGRVLFRPRPATEEDPFLLILLASQAFDEGREEQAIHLIDAAYEAFDQRTNVTRLRLVSRASNIVPSPAAISLSTV